MIIVLNTEPFIFYQLSQDGVNINTYSRFSNSSAIYFPESENHLYKLTAKLGDLEIASVDITLEPNINYNLFNTWVYEDSNHSFICNMAIIDYYSFNVNDNNDVLNSKIIEYSDYSEYLEEYNTITFTIYASDKTKHVFTLNYPLSYYQDN